MAPKVVLEPSHKKQTFQQIEDDDCRTYVSSQTEYTYESIQSLYTYETVCTQITEPANHPGSTTKIRFSSLVDVEETLSRYDYTAKELKASWYSEEEKAKLNAKRMKVVARFESGKPARPGQTYVGLEYSSMEGALRFREAVARHADNVMDEQERQWKALQDDYDLLAQVSKQTSASSKQRAYEIAKLDAESLLEEDSPEDHSFSESNYSESNSDDLGFDLPVAVLPSPRKVKKTTSNKTKKNRTKKRKSKIVRSCAASVSSTAAVLPMISEY